MGNGPAFKAKEKGIEVVVWDNERGKSINIKKSYKDKTTDEWKDSKYYYPDDLPRLVELLQKTINWLEGDHTEVKAEPAKFDDSDIPF